MTTYLRMQCVEAMQWADGPHGAIMRSASQGLRESAQQIVAWVNDNGGEARYEACQKHPDGDGCKGTPFIAVRTAGGWAYAAPGDFIEMGTTVFHPHDGSPCSDNPLAGSCSNRVREFIVRNAAHFNESQGWRTAT